MTMLKCHSVRNRHNYFFVDPKCAVDIGEFELLGIYHFKSKLLRKAFSSALKFGQTHKKWSPTPVVSAAVFGDNFGGEAPVTWFGARGLQIN